MLEAVRKTCLFMTDTTIAAVTIAATNYIVKDAIVAS